ncbi:MAG: zf-TFIIB domain-containing protein [Myxococcota bacterium]
MRDCPSCRKPMQALFFGRLELDRCLACKATWFDRGGLERVSGRRLVPKILGDAAVSRCPACPGLLSSVELEGISAIACVACGGSLVSDAKLDLLAEPMKTRGRNGLSFVCTRCGDRFALEDGFLRESKLCCMRCVPEKPKQPAVADDPLWRLLLFLGLTP